jgi:hypothetical protein
MLSSVLRGIPSTERGIVRKMDFVDTDIVNDRRSAANAALPKGFAGLLARNGSLAM